MHLTTAQPLGLQKHKHLARILPLPCARDDHIAAQEIEAWCKFYA